MTKELKKAISKAEKLSAKQQNSIAELILNEIEWDHALQSSHDKLVTLANEALVEYKKGETKSLDFNS